jgi:hypothetical protein
MIPSIVVGKLASRALDRAFTSSDSSLPSSPYGPLARAQERLARAQAASATVDAYEGYASPLAVLAGAAAAVGGRR